MTGRSVCFTSLSLLLLFVAPSARAADVAESPPPAAAGPARLMASMGGATMSLFGVGATGPVTSLGVGADYGSWRFTAEAGYGRLFGPGGLPFDMARAGLVLQGASGRLHGGGAADIELFGFRLGPGGSYSSSLCPGLAAVGGVDLLRWEEHALSLDARVGAMFFQTGTAPVGALSLTAWL